MLSLFGPFPRPKGKKIAFTNFEDYSLQGEPRKDDCWRHGLGDYSVPGGQGKMIVGDMV